MSQQLKEVQELQQYLTQDEIDEIDKLIMTDLWMPQAGPQAQARESQADITFYGGSAGGGKTDLLIGLSLTDHHESIIFRRESTQLRGIYRRIQDIIGNRDGFSSQAKIWRHEGKIIEFGSCQNLGDEQSHQGIPHDFIGFDEITHFLESQFRFLIGWNRTTRKDQRCRIVCAGNPPTDSDGEWVIWYWGPWLDDKHPNPAKPGELRWYTTDPETGKDIEQPNGDPVMIDGDMVRPLSRTFIPSNIEDNAYLIDTNYKATLQALPEPLRSQMLKGDFKAGRQDNVFQVIPTEWVEAAMDRWQETTKDKMSSVGVDVARGGKDKTVIARRHNQWYAPLLRFPGADTPDGPVITGLVVTHQRDSAPVHIDVIGVGASPYDHGKSTGMQYIPINNSMNSLARDKSGQLSFKNIRAEKYWKFREALDPANNSQVQLPPDSELKADLCSARWKALHGGIIQIESKEDIIKRIGRSPDSGDAVILASIHTEKKANKMKPINYPKLNIV